AVYDEILARFGGASEEIGPEWTANALLNKGVTLVALGRPGEALEAYDEILARFGDAPGGPLREAVADALFYEDKIRSGSLSGTRDWQPCAAGSAGRMGAGRGEAQSSSSFGAIDASTAASTTASTAACTASHSRSARVVRRGTTLSPGTPSREALALRRRARPVSSGPHSRPILGSGDGTAVCSASG